MKPTSKQPSKQKELKPKQYEDLGRIVASVYETGYLDAAKSYKSSFIKGVFGGFGGVIGATVVVALVLWLISVVGNVSFLKPFSDKAQETIQPSK